jgi:hypothetical protein
VTERDRMGGGKVAPDPGEPTGDAFVVQVGTVNEAAALLVKTSQQLDADVVRVRDQAVNAYGAIPPSDLLKAYGYCWGRWSQALQDASTALAQAGPRTYQSAGSYDQTERGNTRRFRGF